MRIQTNFDKNSYEEIGSANNIFTIAEIGLNHNNNLSLAKKMIDAAKEAGCSSAKFKILILMMYMLVEIKQVNIIY